MKNISRIENKIYMVWEGVYRIFHYYSEKDGFILVSYEIAKVHRLVGLFELVLNLLNLAAILDRTFNYLVLPGTMV